MLLMLPNQGKTHGIATYIDIPITLGQGSDKGC